MKHGTKNANHISIAERNESGIDTDLRLISAIPFEVFIAVETVNGINFIRIEVYAMLSIDDNSFPFIYGEKDKSHSLISDKT